MVHGTPFFFDAGPVGGEVDVDDGVPLEPGLGEDRQDELVPRAERLEVDAARVKII